LREFGCDLEGKLVDLTGWCAELIGDKLAIFTCYANAEYQKVHRVNALNGDYGLSYLYEHDGDDEFIG
jgi:hypothetical protein